MDLRDEQRCGPGNAYFDHSFVALFKGCEFNEVGVDYGAVEPTHDAGGERAMTWTPAMLPATLQFSVAMIASAMMDRLTRRVAYMHEEVRVLKELLETHDGHICVRAIVA